MTFPVTGLSRQTWTWRDFRGFTAQNRLYANDAAGAATDVQVIVPALTTVLVAATNAALQAVTGLGQNELGAAQYGVGGTSHAYANIEQKAVFVMQDAAGNLHRFELPAPKLAMFKADLKTLDPAATLTANIITALLATSNGVFFSTRQGTQIINFMGGWSRERKLHKRMNTLTLQPDGTAGLTAL